MRADYVIPLSSSPHSLMAQHFPVDLTLNSLSLYYSLNGQEPLCASLLTLRECHCPTTVGRVPTQPITLEPIIRSMDFKNKFLSLGR